MKVAIAYRWSLMISVVVGIGNIRIGVKLRHIVLPGGMLSYPSKRSGLEGGVPVLLEHQRREWVVVVLQRVR